MKYLNFTSKYIIGTLVVLVLALSFSVVSAQTELTITPSSIEGPPGSKRTIKLDAEVSTEQITIGRLNDSFSRAGGIAFPTFGLGTLESTLTLPSTPGSYSVIATAGATTTHVAVTVTPATLRKTSGDGQIGRPGSLLDSPLVVTVLDVNGRLVIGQVVTFSVISGDGSLSATTVRSGSNGRAETFLILGEFSGKNTVQASVAGGKPVIFTATAKAPLSVLKIHAGDNQTGTERKPLAEPFVVQLLDTENKPVEGYRVRFNIGFGRGRFSDESVRTDSEGFAKTTFTPYSRGTLRIEATAGRVPLVTFTVTMVRPLGKLLVVSGDNQSGPPNRRLPNPLVVEVQDVSKQTVSGITVRFAVAGGGSVSPTSATTDANGRAQTVLKLGDELGDNTVVARVTGITDIVTFKATSGAEVLVGATQRAPMYWVSRANGTLHRLVDDKVEDLIPNVQEVTSIAVDSENGLLYFGVRIGGNSGEIRRSELNGRSVQTIKTGINMPTSIAVDSVAGMLYWTTANGKIKRMAIDSDTRNSNILQNLDDPTAITLSNGYLYWAEATVGISRISLTANEKTVEMVAMGLGEPLSIAIAKGKVYWVERDAGGDGSLKRANLDGSNIQELKVFASDVPTSIVVDGSDRKIYWTKSDKIQRTNLVGGVVKDIVTGLTGPGNIALGGTVPDDEPVAEQTTMSRSKYDVNKDGRINNEDAKLVAYALGTDNLDYDVNGDDKVNFDDLLLVFDNRDNNAAGAPSIVPARHTAVQVDRIQEQIDLLLASGDTSLAAQQVLTYLQHLLVSARPHETVLLANYPNPFNPETWIPYHLADSTDVQINIYNAQGTLVRALTLGHQTAGYYTSRSRAAYWDGRNALGERVASGIYFYQLETDEVSPMRKMVILK